MVRIAIMSGAGGSRRWCCSTGWCCSVVIILGGRFIEVGTTCSEFQHASLLVCRQQ